MWELLQNLPAHSLVCLEGTSHCSRTASFLRVLQRYTKTPAHLRKPEMDFSTTRHHSEMETDEMGQGWGAAIHPLSSTSALKGAPGWQDEYADSKWTVTVAQTVRHIHNQIFPCK